MDELLLSLRSGSVVGARALLGWKLVHETAAGRVSGYIVETEAYDQTDPASHSYKGLTKRNAAMYETAGTIYVYFTYGMHYCLNIVTGAKGHGEAVLIRALEPVEGIGAMMERRQTISKIQLANGPAKLVQALGIASSQNGSLLGQKIHLEPGFIPEQIIQTTRIGITKAQNQPYRFYIADNSYISAK